jgi:tRNA pseudouridine55 synthase
MAMHGFININKPEGMSSFEATRRASAALGAGKAGHAGTLDPFATGVLPVALGEATKAVRYLHLLDKTYVATVRFGVLTDTLDSAGRVVSRCDMTGLDAAAVSLALGSFVGEIRQRPPAFAAVKVGGRRLYRLAREGTPVEAPERAVRIHALRLLSLSGTDAVVEVRCGAGTYIRALARDLGGRLGGSAILQALVRTEYGPFELGGACAPGEASLQRLVPTAAVLEGMRRCVLTDRGVSHVRHGKPLNYAFLLSENIPTQGAGERVALVDRAGGLVAVTAPPESSNSLKLERVFIEV